ncbi:MAG: hypothetical protein ACRD1R_17585, partial [Acidobacteriota bacterium]
SPIRGLPPRGLERPKDGEAPGLSGGLSTHPRRVHSPLHRAEPVFAAYLASAALIPITADAAPADEWIYVQTVERFLSTGHFRIPDVAPTSLVTQIIWGATLAKLFGFSFGILRVSTLMLSVLGGMAVYGISRNLGLPPRTGALAVALFLFNPLDYVLSFSFMTDANYTSLLTIATFFFVRAFRPSINSSSIEGVIHPHTPDLAIGSVVSALAVLLRQVGIGAPLAMAAYLALGVGLGSDKARLRAALTVMAVPSLALAGLYAYFWISDNLPSYQDLIISAIRSTPWEAKAHLLARLSFVALMYVGLFVLPITIPAATRIRRLGSAFQSEERKALLAATLAIGIGIILFASRGLRMPYAASWLHARGVGADDFPSARPALIGQPAVFESLTILAGVSCVLLIAMGTAQHRLLRSTQLVVPQRVVAVTSILVFQIFGALPASFLFREVTTFDRYLLPLLPLSLCLASWAFSRPEGHRLATWSLAVLIAVFSVTATGDWLRLEAATWDLAQCANQHGIANDRLIVGAGWDGYHLWEASRRGIGPDPPEQAPGWVVLWGLRTDGRYRISGVPLEGFRIIGEVRVRPVLLGETVPLYLLRQEGADGIRALDRELVYPQPPTHRNRVSC